MTEIVSQAAEASGPGRGPAGVAWVWGLPLVPWTRARAVDEVDRLIAEGRPSFFITANLHYAMLTAEQPALRAVNERAAFVLADGAPLVWASRRGPTPLPERVAGSDLVYDLAARAAEAGHRLFLLGGPPGIAEAAGRCLERRYPGLTIAGTACPPHRPLDPAEHDALAADIRAARPDLLMVAFGQPKGELWIDRHLDELGVPVGVQVGATLEFVAGRVRRAPKWMQRSGLEWAFRISTDPARLAPRYARNAWFLAGALGRDLTGGGGRP